MEETTVGMQNYSDQDWHAWMQRIQTRFAAQTVKGAPLFTTDAPDAFETFLNSFADPALRQYHNCHCCADFLRKYGTLVTIDAKGHHVSPLWSILDTPVMYHGAVSNLLHTIEHATVTGVFLSSETLWGKPHTNRPVGEEWDHFALKPDKLHIYVPGVQTAEQKMAEKLQDFEQMLRALNEFSLEHLEQAVALLQADALYKSEAVLGVATWLRDLQAKFQVEKNLKRATALVWRAVATAPAGWCHPRSSMIGTLLEDLAAGLPIAKVASNFATKMHPLQYQRAQVAPKAGNVKAAESMIEKLGLASALERRFASLSEITTMWTPPEISAAATPAERGVFSGIKTKTVPIKPRQLLTLAPETMSAARFVVNVLPHATAIYYLTARAHYTALCAPVDPNAGLLFQWDNAAERNPFNWYRYYAGSEPEAWNLPAGHMVRVVGVTTLPWMWSEDFKGEHFERGALFILAGCYDTQNAASALFPGTLRADLHPVRATIEQYSNQHPLLSPNLYAKGQQLACGVLLRDEPKATLTVQVETAHTTQTITLDRWE